MKKQTKKKVVKKVVATKAPSRITDETIIKFMGNDEDEFFDIALVVCKQNLQLFLREKQRRDYIASVKALVR